MKDIVSLQPDAKRINAFRAVLAGTATLVYITEDYAPSALTQIALGSYFFYSIVLLVIGHVSSFFTSARAFNWIDLVWFVVLVGLSTPLTSILFLFFFFAILVASFSCGQVEGRCMTLVATILYAGVCLMNYRTEQDFDWGRLLLRSVFLLTLGFLIAHWGGSEWTLKRQLNLLREVAKLSNPRFGVDQTTAVVMEKIRNFFSADMCVVLYYYPENETYLIRHATTNHHPVKAETPPADLAHILSDYDSQTIAVLEHTVLRGNRCTLFDPSGRRTGIEPNDRALKKAAALDASHFISVPLPFLRARGRMYIASSRQSYSTNAALFLQRVAEQTFAVLEQIELLDKIASEAAKEERKRIGGDLHDSALQPYIGLKLGLDGLLQKIEPDWHLRPDVEALSAMTRDVIADMRSHFGKLREPSEHAEIELTKTLDKQLANFRAYYNLKVVIERTDSQMISDRLTAEIVQFVVEGLTNVRKHTPAQAATVRLSNQTGALSIEIENPSNGAAKAFTPHSISERAHALGGKVLVAHDSQRTSVLIEIPI